MKTRRGRVASPSLSASHVLRSHAARLDCHAEETAVQGMYVSSSSKSCFSLLTLCSVLALPPACTPLPPGVLSLLVAAFALAPPLGLALAGWLALAALPDPLELTLEDAPRCCAPVPAGGAGRSYVGPGRRRLGRRYRREVERYGVRGAARRLRSARGPGPA